MKQLYWPIMVLGIATSLLAAGVWQQTDSFSLNSASAQIQTPVQQAEGIAHADQLSRAFRHVASQTLPAIVSIRTTGKVVRQRVSGRSPFDDPFFRQFFGDDPRFRNFRDQQPQEREFRMPGGQGSGFIIDPDGIILTNRHVVEDADEVTVRLSDGREFVATDIRTDNSSEISSDVAVIRIDIDEKLPALPLGQDDQVQIGDWVLAFGSPFGLDRTVTQGIISAKSRAVPGGGLAQEVIQTDAAINPGNSGGPLVNLRGEVIGINTAIQTRSGGYDGIGFAIPVGLAKWVVDQLLDEGTVRRAYLGIEMQEINSELAEAFSLPVPKGVVVTGVVKDSPADKAGFSEGDVILEVDGKSITSDRNMLGTVERLSIGQSYKVRILRNGQERDLTITVAERPNRLAERNDQEDRPAAEDDGEAGTETIPGTGITVQDLTAELAEQLSLSDADGVVITSVEQGSTGAEAGLGSGMVIVRMGNVSVSDTADLQKAINAQQDADRVLLLVKIQRGNSSIARFVTVKVE
jgi:serine protease Do